MNYMDKCQKLGDEILYWDIIKIIYVDGNGELKAKEITQHCEFDEYSLTLNGIKESLDALPFTTIYVLAENPLDGKVYSYGNRGDYWEEIGKLRGYA